MFEKIVWMLVAGVLAAAWAWLYTYAGGNSFHQGMLVIFSIIAAVGVSRHHGKREG